MKFQLITIKILFFLCITVTLYSCISRTRIPEVEVTYSLTTIRFVPDSLKEKQRQWVTETIKAASQHMTGGDYEDVDDTIDQARITSEDLFEVQVVGLLKDFNNVNYQNRMILPKDMNPYERKVLDSLINLK